MCFKTSWERGKWKQSAFQLSLATSLFMLLGRTGAAASLADGLIIINPEGYVNLFTEV